MKPKRVFEKEFKRQVVEELLSKVSTPAQISRKYGISGGLLQNWKQQHARGKYGNEPDEVEGLKERIKEFEGLVGRLTMDNDFLKKACQNLAQTKKKRESLFGGPYQGEEKSKDGAK